LTSGGYEIQWSQSDGPHNLDLETMHVIDDGTKLIGSNQQGQVVKATKIKLKRADLTVNDPVQEDSIIEDDIIDVVEDELPEETEDVSPRGKSPETIKMLEEIKNQIKP